MHKVFGGIYSKILTTMQEKQLTLQCAPLRLVVPLLSTNHRARLLLSRTWLRDMRMIDTLR